MLATARIAGIMAAKRTHELIPLCHPLALDASGRRFRRRRKSRAAFASSATAKVEAKTGVEMEALTAVSIACLTIYDMCKAVDRGMEFSGIRLVKKPAGARATIGVRERSLPAALKGHGTPSRL